MLKVLVVHGRGGCDWWRTWQPHEEMRKQGLAEVKYLEPAFMTSHDLAEGLKWCDAANIRGLIGKEGLLTLRQYQKLGVRIVLDYDDLYFNVSPFNPAYRNFGTEEIAVKDPTTGEIADLWKDGVNGFNLKDNKMKFHAFKALLQEADAITTTTIYLKDALADISGRNDNIYVLPNAVDLEQWKPLDIRDKYKDKFRFGWAVSASHGEDWIRIKPSLVQFLETHKETKFVCIGDTHMDIQAGLPEGIRNQVEWYPFSNLWEGHYALRMPMLGLDCAIAPLADTEFNKCKSPLKYAEYTAFGWPVIAQKMTPYLEHIIHGETGLLADSTEDWVNCLNSLYENKDLRTKLRFNAMFTIKAMFDLKQVAKEHYELYKTVVGGEKQLITSPL